MSETTTTTAGELTRERLQELTSQAEQIEEERERLYREELRQAAAGARQILSRLRAIAEELPTPPRLESGGTRPSTVLEEFSLWAAEVAGGTLAEAVEVLEGVAAVTAEQLAEEWRERHAP